MKWFWEEVDACLKEVSGGRKTRSSTRHGFIQVTRRTMQVHQTESGERSNRDGTNAFYPGS